MQSYTKVTSRSILLILISWLFNTAYIPVQAASLPVVQAVLFYSPTCGQCQKVLTQGLPPLEQKYQTQLSILKININQPEGRNLYINAVDHFQVPDDRLGVPTLVVGQTVLVGAVEIPNQFPTIIEQGIINGGIPWPDFPGLKDYLPKEAQRNIIIDNSQSQSIVRTDDVWTRMATKFQRDLTGNSLAVIVLLAMVISVVSILVNFLRGEPRKQRKWPAWVVPALAIAGVGISAYMAFVETSRAQAFCGPVGDCNTVQQSQYARLFGVIPIGLLGLIGYLVILLTWAIERSGPDKSRKFAGIGIWIITLFGVLFSIYLTFLEPFVIGATCIWCISQAIVMMILLWATTALSQEYFLGDDEEWDDKGSELQDELAAIDEV